jgi:hypothetical protein
MSNGLSRIGLRLAWAAITAAGFVGCGRPPAAGPEAVRQSPDRPPLAASPEKFSRNDHDDVQGHDATPEATRSNRSGGASAEGSKAPPAKGEETNGGGTSGSSAEEHRDTGGADTAEGMAGGSTTATAGRGSKSSRGKEGGRDDEPVLVFRGRQAAPPAASAAQAAAMAKRAMAEARGAAKRGDVAAGCDAAVKAYEAASAYGVTDGECRRIMHESEKFLESVGQRHAPTDVPTKFE